MLPNREPKVCDYVDLAKDIEKLADFIATKIPGEPSRSESAVDTAIRLLAPYTKPHTRGCTNPTDGMELVCMGCVEARMREVVVSLK